MTKRYDEVIEVLAGSLDGSAPGSFRWRGRRYRVDRQLDSWREAGEWWVPSGKNKGNGNGHRDREYFRVLARPADSLATGDLDPDGYLSGTSGAVYDVYRDHVRGDWRLARVWD